MSDEDFLNTPESSFEEPVEEEQEEELETEVEEEEDDAPESDEVEDDEDEPQGESEDDPETEEDEGEEQEEEPEEGTEDESTETEEEEEAVAEEKDSDTIPDAQEQLKKLFAPFKANGREIQIDSVDDAIKLMQMGANYVKKMSSLKPHLKMIKMLENNSLLDEGKLSYLIDLSKKNPQAIARLLKESGMDPLDVDLEQGETYKPSTYTVKDEEVALDEVLSEIRSTPSYKQTIDVISNKWDTRSKEILYKNPNIIRIINDHVAEGIYEQIMTNVEKERILGRLEGLSDLEAYKAVGDTMFAGNTGEPPKTQAPAPRVVKKAQVASRDPKLKDRKKAAGLTKATTVKKEKEDFNPLALSDEEFEKLDAAGKFV